jgi:predicted nucleotidyltransferase
MNPLQLYSAQIHELCLKHSVGELAVFGSVLTDNFNDSSDIDLVVDFSSIERKEYAGNYFNFKKSLEDLFQRKVDLLEKSALKNPFFLEVLQNTKKIIYAGS